MKITCLIDSLDSGGAQRQMSLLAVLLKASGHDVHLISYYPADFYKYILEKAIVPVKCVHHRNKSHRIWAMRKAIRASNPDVVIAYLETPCIIAELSSLPWRDYALIVSERNVEFPGNNTLKRRMALWLHQLADAVVTNSHAQEAALREIAPNLSAKLTTILNCVDLQQFRPLITEDSDQSGALKILCIGRFEAQKNYLRLLEAVEIVIHKHPEIKLRIDAYGNKFFVNGKPGPHSRYFLELQKAVNESSAKGHFHFHDPVEVVTPLYQDSSVLCLASLYEGCSNVIGEAMACGKPVLASRVGDNPVLVEEGVNGILFDPRDPGDIANAIVRFSRLSSEQRNAMGRAGRQRAEALLSPERFIEQYEQLIISLRESRLLEV